VWLFTFRGLEMNAHLFSSQFLCLFFKSNGDAFRIKILFNFLHIFIYIFIKILFTLISLKISQKSVVFSNSQALVWMNEKFCGKNIP